MADKNDRDTTSPACEGGDANGQSRSIKDQSCTLGYSGTTKLSLLWKAAQMSKIMALHLHGQCTG